MLLWEFKIQNAARCGPRSSAHAAVGLQEGMALGLCAGATVLMTCTAHSPAPPGGPNTKGRVCTGSCGEGRLTGWPSFSQSPIAGRSHSQVVEPTRRARHASIQQTSFSVETVEILTQQCGWPFRYRSGRSWTRNATRFMIPVQRRPSSGTDSRQCFCVIL